MNKTFGLLFFFLVISTCAMSQILPKEAAHLNYRIVGFSFPSKEKVSNYGIQIASGSYFSEDSFKKNIIITLTNNKNKVVAEVPAFGAKYTWRAVYSGDHSNATYSTLHHFSTATSKYVDTSFLRLRITKNAETYKDAYVFLDGNRVLYDMNGQPVWFLPDSIDGKISDDVRLHDLKMTAQGTITFLYEDEGAYEINYNGEILWKAPRVNKITNDPAEDYHHELTRLPNGHYMVLGNESGLWNMTGSPDDSNYIVFPGDKRKPEIDYSQYQKISFGTIIEYDQKGKVVWSWRSSKYFKGSDINYATSIFGNKDANTDENSFYFDEEEKAIYVSFRETSRILKIKYPEGSIKEVYGEAFKPGVKAEGNGLFCTQHSLGKTHDGNLYLLNNNMCNRMHPPEALVLKEDPSEKSGLKKIWEYKIINDTDPSSTIFNFPDGGSMDELPDHSFFVSVSSKVYTRVFIVNHDKKILWNAVPEKYNSFYNRWIVSLQYKASIISSRKELESLIWSQEMR